MLPELTAIVPVDGNPVVAVAVWMIPTLLVFSPPAVIASPVVSVKSVAQEQPLKTPAEYDVYETT